MARGRLVFASAFVIGVACGPSGHTVAPDSSGNGSDGGLRDASPSDGGGTDGGGTDGGGPIDAGGSAGGAITCPGSGNPVTVPGSCGTERWNIKTGTDTQAHNLSLVPKPNTIAALVALPAAGGGTSRESPTETTVWELKNVTLTELKLESDRDYHLVISDGSKTMIAEIPHPSCTTGSPWSCFMSRARAELEARYTITTSPQYPAATITLRGVGFFDYAHGQNGVAPNAIELHPVLELCFGSNCTPD
jgi:hypothetical protein